MMKEFHFILAIFPGLSVSLWNLKTKDSKNRENGSSWWLKHVCNSYSKSPLKDYIEDWLMQIVIVQLLYLSWGTLWNPIFHPRAPLWHEAETTLGLKKHLCSASPFLLSVFSKESEPTGWMNRLIHKCVSSILNSDWYIAVSKS